VSYWGKWALTAARVADEGFCKSGPAFGDEFRTR
jgi:hypothetical protein